MGNFAGGSYSSIGGGWDNDAQAYSATIGGGRNNTIYDDGEREPAEYATIAGGLNNIAGWNAGCANEQRKCTTVGGGEGNKATSAWGTVAGGKDNHAGMGGAT